MEAEIVVMVCAVAGNVLVGGGLILTWKRNGTTQKYRDREMAGNQAARDERINNNLVRLNDAHIKASDERISLKDSLADMKLNCANISGNLLGRQTAAESDIRELKDKHKEK